MIKLQEQFPLLVCFAHKLHMCIARSFTDKINEEKEFKTVHSIVIDIIKFVNK